MRYLTVPCGAPRSTIAAADASGPPEHKGRRERGRRGRIAETLGNIAERLTERRTGTACDLPNTSPASLFRSSACRVPLPSRSGGQQGPVTVFRARQRLHPPCDSNPRDGVGAGVQRGRAGCGGTAGRVEGGINCANTAEGASKMRRRTDPTVCGVSGRRSKRSAYCQNDP